jgi:hypothetical protein
VQQPGVSASTLRSVRQGVNMHPHPITSPLKEAGEAWWKRRNSVGEGRGPAVTQAPATTITSSKRDEPCSLTLEEARLFTHL